MFTIEIALPVHLFRFVWLRQGKPARNATTKIKRCMHVNSVLARVENLVLSVSVYWRLVKYTASFFKELFLRAILPLRMSRSCFALLTLALTKK